jgi:phospholipase/lecithinase/hemolysin
VTATSTNTATATPTPTCLGAGNGLTLGFWHNKNGQAALTGADLCALNALNLRNANGTVFDPIAGCANPTTAQIQAGKTALSNWLIGANATNMANMLSAQLATMKLNVIQPIKNASVDGNALIFAGTAPNGCSVPGLSGTGFITVNDLMSAANSASNYSLASNANTTASGPARTCQEFMKTALDRANNNQNFLIPCS